MHGLPKRAKASEGDQPLRILTWPLAARVALGKSLYKTRLISNSQGCYKDSRYWVQSTDLVPGTW